MKKFSFDHVVLSPKDQIGLHKQSSWELSYIIRGEGLRTIGDRTERFQSGEIALVVPEMPHQWKFDMPSDGEDALIENITITFPPILLTQLSNTFDEMAALSLWFNGLEESIILPKEANREMRNVMHKMIKQVDCERLVALFRLLVMIWKSDGKHSFGQFQTDRGTDIVNKVISYLHCNFKRPVTIQQLAAYTGMNGTSLCSLFKRKKQKTIMQYLLDYRMMMVKEGLRRGGSSISQVCYECGFRDVPYFNRTSNRNCSAIFANFNVLYISFILHQTATVAMMWSGCMGCISPLSYIKPQPLHHPRTHPCRCISPLSYIKPQLHHCVRISSRVVYLLYPTSNRNQKVRHVTQHGLYISFILHQTATLSRPRCFAGSCISPLSYIKPQRA